MIPVEERFGSRKQVGGYYEFLYWAKPDAGEDELSVRDAIFDAAPDVYAGVLKDGVSELEDQGGNIYYGTVVYKIGDLATGSTEASQSFEFDTSTGAQHITEAINSHRDTASYGVTGLLDSDIPDLGTAINVDSDGNVNGVDIGVKALDFSVTRKIPLGSSGFDSDYLQTLYDLSWTYNKNDAVPITFETGITITFPAGTILFKGARGGGNEGERVSVTYLLSYSPNLTNFLVDGITVTSKLGWQYCWAYRRPQVVEGASGGKKWLVPKAVAVYVDDLYDAGDLTDLNFD